MMLGSSGPTVLLVEHDGAVTEAVAFGVRMAAPT